MNLKTVRLTRFQKPQLQSVSIFFEFVHLWFHLYSLCHLHLTLTFWAVIFVSLNLVAVSAVWILIKQYNNNSYSEVMNIWKSYTRTAGLRVIWKKIIAVVDATFAVAKRKPEKKFRLVRDSDPWPLRYRCSSLPFELTSLACCCFRLSDGSWYVAYSFYPRLWFCYDLGLEWTRNLWLWGWN